MIEGPILRDDRVTHDKSGGKYVVRSADGGNTLLKVGEPDRFDQPCATNGWVNAVIYFDPTRDMMFVRDEETFRRNFTRRS